MMRRPLTPSRRGFTLLELLIVISILSVVGTVGTSAFVSLTAAWNETRTVTELDRQAENVFDSIRRDVNAAISHELSGLTLTSTSGEVPETRIDLPVELQNDRFSIPVRASEVSRALDVAARVGYSVDRTSESTLIRTIGPTDGGFPSTGREDLTPRARVLGFSVEYLPRAAGSMWVETWDRPQPPAAIRISLSLEDRDRSDFQIARNAVIPVPTR